MIEAARRRGLANHEAIADFIRAAEIPYWDLDKISKLVLAIYS